MQNDTAGTSFLSSAYDPKGRAQRAGQGVLMTALRANARLFVAVLAFSSAINVLMLTGPFYMLLVYDRVLSSGSTETLVALSILASGLFVAIGVLDFSRARVLSIAGARFQIHLDEKLFNAALARPATGPGSGSLLASQRDVEKVKVFISSSALAAFLDFLAAPLFLTAIFGFHMLLGILALGGGLLLGAISGLNHVLSNGAGPTEDAASMAAESLALRVDRDPEASRTLSVAYETRTPWLEQRLDSLLHALTRSVGSTACQSSAKALRLFLQSAMLGLGAWLVLKGELSTGSMFVVSVLLGRALAPVEMLASQMPAAKGTLQAWRRLTILLSSADRERIRLTRPNASLEVDTVSVMSKRNRPPELHSISFRLQPGQAIGIIGPSGSGKTTLARSIIGAVHPTHGCVRIGGVPIGQFQPSLLAQHIGYVPQIPALFDGTIAQNIARFKPQADLESVISAAMDAGAHEMIAGLADGYETQIQSGRIELSAGQLQRICLARAFFGKPQTFVLDEPSTNLDSDGSAAMNASIRLMKSNSCSVVVTAHRPSAIQECDLILVLAGGRVRLFGPREAILRELARDSTSAVRETLAGFSR